MGIFDIFKKDDTSKTLPKDEREQWICDTYALWSHANYGDYRYFCGAPYSKEFASELRYLLSRDWGIKNKKECIEMIENLKVNSGDPAILAWDLCRATQIYGIGFVGGYFTREEMNQGSVEIAKFMQSLFDSWEALVCFYLEGHDDWAREVFGENAVERIEQRRIIYQEIKNAANPAYAIEWDLEF